MYIAGPLAAYFTVALVIFWIQGMAHINDYNRSVARSYSSWKESKRWNDGDLRGAKRERSNAIDLVKNVMFWARCLVWPLVIPTYLVIWIAKFFMLCFEIYNSIRRPQGYDQA